jgi:hypothetical protein
MTIATDKLEVLHSTNSARDFELTTREALTTYPAVVVRPLTADTAMAFDVMPNGDPAADMKAWGDFCGMDCRDTPQGVSATVNGARVSVRSDRVEYGSFAYGGADDLPVVFLYGNDPYAYLDAGRLFVGAGGLTAPYGAAIATTGRIFQTVDNASCHVMNRKNGDGDMLLVQTNGVTRGGISVAGNTVGFNSLCGTHLTQIDGNPDLLPGTVLESTDALCSWKVDEWEEVTPARVEIVPTIKKKIPAVYRRERVWLFFMREVLVTAEREIVLREGGRIDHPEQRTKHVEQYYGPLAVGATYQDDKGYAHSIVDDSGYPLPKCKISSTPGSRAVYGGYFGRDDDRDVLVAGLGAYKIRIGKGVAVRAGDYVESAGDGTARPQVSDALLASTIAKITSAKIIDQYDDGSYTVACTLHCG